MIVISLVFCNILVFKRGTSIVIFYNFILINNIWFSRFWIKFIIGNVWRKSPANITGTLPITQLLFFKYHKVLCKAPGAFLFRIVPSSQIMIGLF